MSRALVVGSINMDLVMRAERLPQPGETLVGGSFTVVPGGKGANQAASVARLGRFTTLIGAVGADDFGAAALGNLQRQGVDTTSIKQMPDHATGVAVIVVDQAGENTIIVASGANHTLTPADLEGQRDVFSQAEVVGLQCEIPLPTVTAAIDMARSVGATTVLNAAPALPDLPTAAYQVDYLVVNEQETEWLSGIRPTSVGTAIAAARRLRERGARCVVVTLGALGCAYATDSGSGRVAAPTVPVIDTTGAGDAFVGGLMAALLDGLPLLQALAFANCAGALAVTKLGAQTSLPDRSSVADLFERVGSDLPQGTDTPPKECNT